mmetsp:Transcript_26894/g.50268  ORF Transcript_26894/g.50268 Transcript_26894/m.50268 type:complete len:334 (-) Transcript_26894:229-1230(-)
MQKLIYLTASLFSLSNAACYDVFAWISHNSIDYSKYNWDAIRTVGFFGDLNTLGGGELKDFAHERGIKLVRGVSMGDDMNNATARSEWIQDQIQTAVADGYDGVNIDYEGQAPKQNDGYTALVVETAAAFHEQLPGSEVSIDAPVYPEYEGRNYDYITIAEACDYMFVMAYDAEFWDNVQCAGENQGANCSLACSSYQVDRYGIESYIGLGVAASKLYLGLPWYGLKYEYIAGVPFFTGQIQYKDILQLMDTHQRGWITSDESSKTKIFHCVGRCFPDDERDKTTEVWFDDAQTLEPKYALAGEFQLKGVGMWEADHAEGTPYEDDMWAAMCQ